MDFDKNGEPRLDSYIRDVSDICWAIEDLKDGLVELNCEKESLYSALEELISIIEDEFPEFDVSKFTKLL